MNGGQDQYTFTERQLDLFRACIDSWRSTTFWALMYMQSFLFGATNVDNIGHELDTQPAQYALIFRQYYGKAFASVTSLNTELEPQFFKPYLTALKEGRGTESAAIKRNWLAEIKKAAAIFGSMNPYWSATLFDTMLSHYVNLLCVSAENDILGKYQEIGNSYLILDRLAVDLGEYMAVGIIKQFQVR